MRNGELYKEKPQALSALFVIMYRELIFVGCSLNGKASAMRFLACPVLNLLNFVFIDDTYVPASCLNCNLDKVLRLKASNK